MDEPSYAELQRVVQRKLGRCLIRIQQYELLLKEMVAKSDIAGELGAMEAQIATNVFAVANKTMGLLVGELTEKCIRPTLADPENTQPDGSPADGSVAEVAAVAEDEHPAGWASFRTHVSMAPDVHAQLKAELQDLVDLRNDLVHHFVEGQDLVSDEGCIAAEMYLDDCFAEIDRHLVSLRGWAISMNEAKRTMASFMAGPEYQEFLLAELSPKFAQCGAELPVLIDLLQQAEAAQLKVDGWAALNNAIAFIKEVAPEETLTKHSFGSWRQVLHEAGRFETRRFATQPGAPVETWYRSRS